jgi:hypothetical protein
LRNSKLRAAKVRRLWEDQLGLCRWCGKETFPPDDPRRFRPESRKLSGKAATLDHLYTKKNILRQATIIGRRYVMACSTCNSRLKYDADRAALADLLRQRLVVDWPPVTVYLPHGPKIN